LIKSEWTSGKGEREEEGDDWRKVAYREYEGSEPTKGEERKKLRRLTVVEGEVEAEPEKEGERLSV